MKLWNFDLGIFFGLIQVFFIESIMDLSVAQITTELHYGIAPMELLS